MTTPDPQSQSPLPVSKDRVYRSPMGIVGGVLLLALIIWLGIDAIVAGDGRTPWMALAAMLLLVPLVVAFTLRPAVHADDDRLRVRNPLRVVTVPWAEVASLRSGYSNEVVTGSGAKYQLWAIPVSLRGRKKAARHEERRLSGAAPRGRRGGGLGGMAGGGVPDGPVRADTDQVMDDLRALWEARGEADTSKGEVSTHWAYEIIAPAVAGAVALAVLLGLG
ncbi:PH domain-containing protein [Streptomyces sp. SID8352]|uniref:PH domain-containing protein n=1 Tax=Streptomyces sp. SID8352 TaxID=2690338 RepID=UPI001369398E|nr:PH domain-containing protein [Streptomyces sp. SID8352]MYU25730.1 PH domain-containing protein [Streptomyces sp. SID8352]